MVAARKGMANKVGYLAAHSAIVLICIGGLADGDLIVRAQMALLGKSPRRRRADARRAAAAQARRRQPDLPRQPAGGRRRARQHRDASMPDGVVLQDLPFDVELKKFIVEYYETGMPKLFASEIVIHDHDTGGRSRPR